MIPIKLVVEGWYSYREKAVIDFGRLAEGRLFGIFGAVGSGKSALLEAMTFALYGNMERMDSGGRKYNVMNLGANRFYIEFEFEVHRGGQIERYSFRAEGKRNSKRFEDISRYERKAYQWQEDAWKPLESANAAHILHLKYEHFIKTAIIPQGQFQQFLHLQPAKRTELLKDLFQLDQYDLADPCKALIRESEEALARLEGELKQIPEVSLEDLAMTEEQLQNATEEKDSVEAQLDALEKELILWREQKHYQENLSARQKGLEEINNVLQLLEPQLSIFAERKKELEHYLRLKEVFQLLIIRIDQNELASRLNQETLEELERKEAPLKVQVQAQEKEFQKSLNAYEKREVWSDKANEIRLIQEMLKLAEKSEAVGIRVINGRKVVEEGEAEEENLKLGVRDFEEQLRELKKELPDAELLRSLDRWFQRQEQEVLRFKEVQLESQVYKEDEKQFNLSFQDWLSASLLENKFTGTNLPMEEIKEALEEKGGLIKEELQGHESQRRELQIHARLADFSTALEDGKACPLCGAIEHPQIYTPDRIDQDLEEIERLIEDCKDRREQLREHQNELREWMLKEKSLIRDKERVHSILKSRQESMQAHLENFCWPDFSPDHPEKLDVLQERDRKLKKEIIQLEEQLDQARKDAAEKRRILDLYRSEINALEQKKAGMDGDFSAKQESLNQFVYSDFLSHSIQDLEDEANQYDARYLEINEDYHVSRNQLEKLRQELVVFENELEKARKESGRLDEDQKTLDEELNQLLDSHGIPGLEQVRQVLNRDIDFEEEQGVIQRFFHDIQRSQGERERILQEMKTLREKLVEGFLDKPIEELELQQKHLKDQQDQISSSLGAIKKIMETQRHNQKERQILLKRQQAATDRALVLKDMERLFKGKGFVKYISSIYLKELFRRANLRFQKLTRHQLSLEINEKDEFVVRDNLNGGKLRSIRTLSGGQTFQASLCLALALADNISARMGSSQNFFFLDEGFGTLDRESLVFVFETLKQLRKENRIVGIISHVEELQQEIDHCLFIQNREGQGSRIRASWDLA